MPMRSHHTRSGNVRESVGPRAGRLVSIVAAVLLTMMGVAQPALAQGDLGLTADGVSLDAVDDGDRTLQIVEIDETAYPEVDVVIAVPPAFAGELQANSFGLTESGQVMATDVEKLREQLEVVVVIDTSGSMRGSPISAAKNAALDFVDTLAADVDIAVVGFGQIAILKSGFDESRSQTRAAISALEATGETSLYDGLVLASEQFETAVARRFVVVLSDGNDTASSSTLAEATLAVDDADLKLYAITLTSPEVEFEALETLAAQVDGELVAASDEAQLVAVYGAVASRLTNLYRLTYQSRDSGQVPLVISVDVAGDLAFTAEVVAINSDGDVQVDPGDPGQVANGSPARPEAGEIVSAVVPPTDFLSSTTALYIGASALFLVLAALLFALLSRESSGPSAMQRLNLSAAVPRRSGLASVADRASAIADRALERGKKGNALDEALERSGLEMRPGEFLATAAFAALGFGALGLVLNGPLFGLIFFAAALLGSRIFLKMKASRRQKKFAGQLGDTLMMIAGSMRAGHGIMESIDTVASQAESPTGVEFSRAVTESRIGRDMVDSLYDIADRTGSEDFIWVVRAISINRELGGDLAEIIDNVGETIRDRNRLRDQVKALSAEGKVSGLILFALPFVVGGWVQFSNPAYMDAMLQETTGKAMLGLAGFEMFLGGLWLKKLVKVDF
jgi:tight adherence protein B